MGSPDLSMAAMFRACAWIGTEKPLIRARTSIKRPARFTDVDIAKLTRGSLSSINPDYLFAM